MKDFKKKVTRLLEVWRDWEIYPSNFLIGLGVALGSRIRDIELEKHEKVLKELLNQ